MKNIYIRRAAVEEVICILSEPQIASKMSRPVLDSLGAEHNYTLVVIGKYKLLVSYRQVKPKGTVEVYIACPTDSIKASRALAMLTMKWLVDAKKLVAKSLVTR